ncbi:MAG: hydroxyacid dehydrogenase [Hyphomicrobiales bacterium]|nr:hydroxyacid dehydrogenase [Hyphomicrobiales bacterium]
MPHILVAGKIHEDGVALLKSTPGITFDLVSEVSLNSYAPLAGKADAILIRTQPMPASVIAEAKRLQIVSRHGVGYDAVDISALNARGIPLVIVGDVNSRAVAEHTLMLMLAAARCTVAHDIAIRSGNWQVRNQFQTCELDGKALLLIGFGRIGRRVASLAQAFGMIVMAHDLYAEPRILAEAGVGEVTDLDAAYASADYISLHVPASSNGPLLGPRELSLLKPTAIVVNTARGELIDESALDEALRAGRLGAAAIDVLVDEPPRRDHPLLLNPRVTISPHSAGLTRECAARMAVASVRNILDYFAGTIDRRLLVNASEATAAQESARSA